MLWRKRWLRQSPAQAHRERTSPRRARQLGHARCATYGTGRWKVIKPAAISTPNCSFSSAFVSTCGFASVVTADYQAELSSGRHGAGGASRRDRDCRNRRPGRVPTRQTLSLCEATRPIRFLAQGASAKWAQRDSLEDTDRWTMPSRQAAFPSRPRGFDSIVRLRPRIAPPLPALPDQKPTGDRAAAMARDWSLRKLAKRLEGLARS
jgi:hypothetical protein